jgi:hypothetical protein
VRNGSLLLLRTFNPAAFWVCAIERHLVKVLKAAATTRCCFARMIFVFELILTARAPYMVQRRIRAIVVAFCPQAIRWLILRGFLPATLARIAQFLHA